LKVWSLVFEYLLGSKRNVGFGWGGGRLVASQVLPSIVLAPSPVSSACWRRSRLASCAFCSPSSWWSRCRSRRVRCAEISACISVVTDCLLIRTVAFLGGSDWLVIYSLCAIGQLTGPGRDPCRSRRSGPDLLLLCMLRNHCRSRRFRIHPVTRLQQWTMVCIWTTLGADF
jgi:hypothetical protein